MIINNKQFKPMRAAKLTDPKDLNYPVLVSPKLDGIRVAINDKGLTMTRSLKEIPNKFIKDFFLQNADILKYLDGELIVGSPTAPDCFKTTSSAVMSREGIPSFIFYIFDHIEHPNYHFEARRNLSMIPMLSCLTSRLKVVPQIIVNNVEEFLQVSTDYIEQGYEGVMIRNPEAPYKFGESTLKEGYLIKYKLFEDTEATIIGFEEELQNNNEAKINALGRTERSTHKDGKIGKGSLGSFILQSKTWPKPFGVGAGLTHKERKEYWENREELLGKIVKFKFMPYGSDQAPRIPTFLGFRDPIDMDNENNS